MKQQFNILFQTRKLLLVLLWILVFRLINPYLKKTITSTFSNAFWIKTAPALRALPISVLNLCSFCGWDRFSFSESCIVSNLVSVVSSSSYTRLSINWILDSKSKLLVTFPTNKIEKKDTMLKILRTNFGHGLLSKFAFW